MTRGQEAFSINFTNENTEVKLGPVDQEKLNIVKPSAEEITLHDNYKLKIKSANNW